MKMYDLVVGQSLVINNKVVTILTITDDTVEVMIEDTGSDSQGEPYKQTWELVSS